MMTVIIADLAQDVKVDVSEIGDNAHVIEGYVSVTERTIIRNFGWPMDINIQKFWYQFNRGARTKRARYMRVVWTHPFTSPCTKCKAQQLNTILHNV